MADHLAPEDTKAETALLLEDIFMSHFKEWIFFPPELNLLSLRKLHMLQI